MPSTVPAPIRRVLLLGALAAQPWSTLAAQSSGGTFSVPLSFQVGVPQGEFAENVEVSWGFGLGGMWMVNDYLGLRAGFDLAIYGHDRRRISVPAGAAGTIDLDISTTNAIAGFNLGGQLGVPGPGIRPYVGGLIGISNFSTRTTASGTDSDDDPVASTTNSSDNAFSKIAIGGLYIPMGSSGTVLDLGVRYAWNGESVRYLTRGDISEDAGGNVVLNPRETRADLLTIVIGVSFGRRRAR
ncbi:MAG: outer membrane beta-barrel protein [Gemmatimonadaceae bacterium]|nr:outer membrane beta-barrel protein [Gemmatimonadaceae bacterium]